MNRVQCSVARVGRVLFAVLYILLFTVQVCAGVLLQGFYWDASTGDGRSWWLFLAQKANELRKAGFTAVWIPPVLKGASGGYSNGYDPFDDYDIGSKYQKGTFATRWGTREELQMAVAVMRANGLDVYVDMVLNHRNGDDGYWNFRYKDAYGNEGRGKFQKGYYDFHPNYHNQCPDVPGDYLNFGRDLCHTNPYVADGLKAAGDWLTKALGIQGYRLDNVKGISIGFLRDYLSYGAMANRLAIGEYWDTNRDTLNWWANVAMGGRVHVFDFALREELKNMCNAGGFYDMRRLDHAGLVGIDPWKAVTFVENHDTDHSDPIYKNKHLAYAYILTSEGYSTVFWKDYAVYGMKPLIDRLIWIHENLAEGTTQERWKDEDLFVYERMGGRHLLVGLNDNGIASRTVTVQTGFSPYTSLHDYTGNMPDRITDASGRVILTVPANSYVAYSVAGVTGTFQVTPQPVTQEFAGAEDLDIPPADDTRMVKVCKICVEARKPITAELYWDSRDWTDATAIVLELRAMNGRLMRRMTVTRSTPQGATMTFTPFNTRRYQFYQFYIRSRNTPAGNRKPAYWLKVTYTAPSRL